MSSRRSTPRWWMLAALCTTLAGCPGDVDPGAADSNTTGLTGINLDTSASATGNDSATGVLDADGSATQGPQDGGTQGDSGTTADGTESADTGSSDGTATGNDPGNPVDCGGNVYACGDGIDNDGDGFIDLLDPECTGPCDDDETSFQTGLPGDNMDCKQDCFFDGNSGQGDDGCIWHLKCDPANPGEFINCEYTGGNNCADTPPGQDQACIDYCEPFVPPGCDCFGCCEVQTPEGPLWIFLNSHPDCALDNLEACTQCTPQIDDCGNPCEPDGCEVCFGETEPPAGCGGVTCPGGDPCVTNDDCPSDYFCYLSCCYPPPPG